MAFGSKKGKENTEAASGTQENRSGETAKGSGTGPKINRRNVHDLFPEYEYPGPKPENAKEQREWRKKVLIQRKKLKKALKRNHIYRRPEYEQTAFELGLSLDDGRRAGFFAWWKWAWAWLKTGSGIRSLIALGTALLALLFLLSYLTELAGSFTVNLTADMMRAGFILSEGAGFERSGSRLFSEQQEQINNITVDDVEDDVDNKDGSHNGSQYVAYTFYIKNNGDKASDYKYTLKMLESTMGVDKAVWLMLFEDGHQVVYAAPSEDGDNEKLFGYRNPPFYDVAYDPGKQYYERNGYWGLATTAFQDDNVVVQGLVQGVQPGDIHKYTVVIWLEGNDPECTDDIFGGFARYAMDFSIIGEDDNSSIFNGIWRTEYDDYANGMVDVEEVEEVDAGTAGKTSNGVRSDRSSESRINSGGSYEGTQPVPDEMAIQDVMSGIKEGRDGVKDDGREAIDGENAINSH